MGQHLKKAPGHGYTTTWYKFWQHLKAFIITIILYKLQKDPFCLIILYDILFYFTHVYKAPVQEKTIFGDKFFWCKQKGIITLITSYMFQKIPLPLILCTFFHDFIHVHSPWAGADNTLGPNFDVNRKASSLWSFVASLKKSLQPLTLYTSFHDVINIYIRMSGADNPQGTKVWCQQKLLVASVICYKFQKNLFEVWFYTHFFMILYMYIAPGQGLTTPWGRNFDVYRNILSLRSFVASFKKLSLKSDFIQFFSWFYTCI